MVMQHGTSKKRHVYTHYDINTHWQISDIHTHIGCGNERNNEASLERFLFTKTRKWNSTDMRLESEESEESAL